MTIQDTKATPFRAGQGDIAVIGAGHAGIEAALAGARMGKQVLLFTLSLDAIGNMPCNPSIGGTGKGHLVYEIEALGGEMGRAADANMLQSRMLNLSKGPAVHSLRYQADRRAYHSYMKRLLEDTPGIRIVQAEITDIDVSDGEVTGVVTRLGARYEVKAVVICAGTYLSARCITGEASVDCGPDYSMPARFLPDSLRGHGVELRRFKTGTPARIHADSIDYSMLEVQPGDEQPYTFCRDTVLPDGFKQKDCYIAYTNERTHEIIRQNLHRSPLYSGQIHGTGARYCPSIEDKIVRFSDKERHQLFLEPMGEGTKEVYVQGLSSSLPEEVQFQVLHSIRGLENAQVMRTAYAIEYECCDPTQLSASLEFKHIRGLFGAGQFNGTSGYEEAAAQGLIAGINAARLCQDKPPVTLSRASSYIGMLIDDLVVKGTNEPYRVMTSRTEYRLLLRQDNAEQRLSAIGFECGLISGERYNKILAEQAEIKRHTGRLERLTVPPSGALAGILEGRQSTPVVSGMRFAELLKRPELDYKSLMVLDNCPISDKRIICGVEIAIKYEGYIRRQLAQVEQLKKLENRRLPSDIDYTTIKGIRIEAAQKLSKQRPESIGMASRISGISPADISVLIIYLEQRRREGRE
ncbi:MAG: tRNA uridine-5-carboxymethylaminomethyl(34) synthesis enzyme MnmG [Eubacteriales bacterium]